MSAAQAAVCCCAVAWLEGAARKSVCTPGSALGAEGGAWRHTCLHARPCAGCRRWGLETYKDQPVCWVSACQAVRWVQKVGLGDPLVCMPGPALGAEGGVWTHLSACQAVRWVQKVGLWRPTCLHARQCAGCRRWGLETHRTSQCAGCLRARQCAGCGRWGLETHLSACQALRWVQKVGL